MLRLHYFFHIVFYYVAWLIGIHLAANHYAFWSTTVVLFLVLIQLAWQTIVARETTNLYLMIILLTVAGSLIDTLYVITGLIYFESNPFSPYFSPPWMISIWISFSIIYYALLKNLFTRYILLSILSLVGFSIAYYAGAAMGAASFPHGIFTSIIVGATWSIALPLCMYLYNSLTRKK